MPDLKPIKAKPSFYAFCFEALKEIALKYGYNLILHGSLNRDLDLVAIAWVDEPKDEFQMIQEFDEFLNGKKVNGKDHYLFSVLPGNRQSYVINLNRGERHIQYKDEQWYVDISVKK